MGKLFGTDGVRGIANTELTAELALKIGRAGAMVLTEECSHTPKIIIGKDPRISSDMLENAIISGICSAGADAISIGVVPTPAVAYLVRLLGCDAGVVISASHNPAKYNGIKYFNGQGYKLSDEIEDRIEEIIFNDNIKPNEKVGKVTYDKTAYLKYAEFLKSCIKTDLKGLKIGIDCSNGASYKIAPMIFEELGAEVKVINNSPDGLNINLNCGSTHIEGLSKCVIDNKLDLGLAFDGDADRLLAVDSDGKLVDGDKVMLIAAQNMDLKKNTVVATVMSNLGMFIAAKDMGINVLKAAVGDRYVLEEMLKGGYNLGGEQSGHVIFLDHNTTGDGILTALKLCEIIKTSRKTLAELASCMQVFPQVLINVPVSNDKKYTLKDNEIIQKKIAEFDEIFKDEGRVLIRPSGTEALVRVMIEGKELEFITEKAKELAALIEKEM